MRKKIKLSMPKLGFIVVSRAALAFGAGLLMSRRLSERRRNRAGQLLIGAGALTTIPAAMMVARGRKSRRNAALRWLTK